MVQAPLAVELPTAAAADHLKQLDFVGGLATQFGWVAYLRMSDSTWFLLGHILYFC